MGTVTELGYYQNRVTGQRMSMPEFHLKCPYAEQGNYNAINPDGTPVPPMTPERMVAVVRVLERLFGRQALTRMESKTPVTTSFTVNIGDTVSYCGHCNRHFKNADIDAHQREVAETRVEKAVDDSWERQQS